uniref:Uncharacterized protein n=1 Tax=Lutzomyia longipalpis TaxID=7200 RepID=A0A1B0C9Y4_LUTLO
MKNSPSIWPRGASCFNLNSTHQPASPLYPQYKLLLCASTDQKFITLDHLPLFFFGCFVRKNFLHARRPNSFYCSPYFLLFYFLAILFCIPENTTFKSHFLSGMVQREFTCAPVSAHRLSTLNIVQRDKGKI